MENQEKVWDDISEWWDQYRVHSLKEVKDFLKNKKGKILDLGCGNGRNFQPNKGVIYGVDFSEKMIEYASKNAKKKKLKVILEQRDIDKLDFKNNFFDSGVFIAVLHCIPTAAKRRKVLKELYRVLKPKAEVIVSVWYKSKKRFEKIKKEGYVAWKAEGKKCKRYVYIFDRDELVKLLESAGFTVTKVLEMNELTKFSRKNIVVHANK